MESANPDDRFEDARQLWAGRFQTVLTTHSLAESGYPFPSVVPYCLDRDGNALMLLSHLAQHTKNLVADPRCGLSVADPCEGDVQQSMRLACLADAAPVDSADQKSHARWFRLFPASRPYYEQLNFQLYRLRPRRFHFNSGFATARWLGNERIVRISPWNDGEETRLIGALAGLVDLLNQLAEDAVHPIRLVGVDPWGLDLIQGAHLRRLPLTGPLSSVESLQSAALAAWRNLAVDQKS